MGKKKSPTSIPSPCNCDHPFQCDCGNRPERPSRGHKWDPSSQTWGGKGHKQKGASGPGQANQIGKAAVTTTTGGTQLKESQQLPSSLLCNWCAKNNNKMLPKFHPVVRNVNNMWKFRVIIPDGKAKGNMSDKDLFFVPSTEVMNEEQAKEEAALLALDGLCPRLPHHLKMPDPYRTTWLNMRKCATASTPPPLLPPPTPPPLPTPPPPMPKPPPQEPSKPPPLLPPLPSEKRSSSPRRRRSTSVSGSARTAKRRTRTTRFS